MQSKGGAWHGKGLLGLSLCRQGLRVGITAWTGVGSLPGRDRAPFHTRPPCPALAPEPPGYLQRRACSEGMGLTVGSTSSSTAPSSYNCGGVNRGVGDGRGLYYVVLCCLPSLLGLALSSNGLHGLAHSLLIPQELHGLDRFQVLVQLVDNGDASGQVQLHDGLF